ncbi:hypothetical protein [Staphylococcus sp. 17KM0847]|uniref:hypothetical protein n=1 Tax=Staphylococcus sp. 17KM0847 TaxID=2583989 RepID=UPI0015DBFD78|nr:hypothetical protein [Staphylococcus sp. 17KM0847]QLK86545.1 hypothetical protein FGL66_07505 [Staphylococcus sp. 17KM0847]
MKIGLYIALICGVFSGLSIFFDINVFSSTIIPIILGMIGIIATLWTLPNPHISNMLKLGGIFINLFPVIVGLIQLFGN